MRTTIEGFEISDHVFAREAPGPACTHATISLMLYMSIFYFLGPHRFSGAFDLELVTWNGGRHA